MYMKRVIILASGAGSNAENIINYFQNSTEISVVKVLCNKKEAGVFKRCKKLNKDCEWFSREDFFKKNTILDKLIEQTDFIVLAGFLWKIPEAIVKAFPNRIINIHPALLPNYTFVHFNTGYQNGRGLQQLAPYVKAIKEQINTIDLLFYGF